MNQEKLNVFIKSFTSNSGGCRRTCFCQKEFYDNFNEGYTWDEGELESLLENKNATPLNYSVESVIINGREYVSDCDCWHKIAEAIVTFLDNNSYAVAAYLTNEKKRKRDEADNSPTVE